ncbi:MAG TPA: ester cyclase [Terriglobales bacterium]|nr:ester cyclase [Terriglobales bacterium]
MNLKNEPDQNKRLVLEHYRATVSEMDFAAIRRQLSPNFVDHESPPGTPVGPEWVTHHVASFHAAFPDLQVEIHELIAERDLVAVRATWSGTHKGDYMGFPATHRKFQLKGIVIWRVQEGRIVERWGCLDRLGLLQQLGLTAPSPAYDFEQHSNVGARQ